MVSNNNIYNYLKLLKYSSFFQPHISVRPDFRHIPQPKQNIARLNARANMIMQLPSIMPVIKEMYKIQNNPTIPNNYFCFKKYYFPKNMLTYNGFIIVILKYIKK